MLIIGRASVPFKGTSFGLLLPTCSPLLNPPAIQIWIRDTRADNKRRLYPIQKSIIWSGFPYILRNVAIQSFGHFKTYQQWITEDTGTVIWKGQDEIVPIQHFFSFLAIFYKYSLERYNKGFFPLKAQQQQAGSDYRRQEHMHGDNRMRLNSYSRR